MSEQDTVCHLTTLELEQAGEWQDSRDYQEEQELMEECND